MMPELTPEILNELERLENSATPGPWQSNGYYDRSRAMLRPSHAIWTKDPPDDASPEEWANQKAIARPFDGLPSHQCDEATAGINMDLLATLRNHARALIDAARERDRLRAAIDEAITYLHQLPMGIDPDGVDPDNLTPTDAASHVGSLAARVLIEALERKDGD